MLIPFVLLGGIHKSHDLLWSNGDLLLNNHIRKCFEANYNLLKNRITCFMDNSLYLFCYIEIFYMNRFRQIKRVSKYSNRIIRKNAPGNCGLRNSILKLITGLIWVIMHYPKIVRNSTKRLLAKSFLLSPNSAQWLVEGFIMEFRLRFFSANWIFQKIAKFSKPIILVIISAVFVFSSNIFWRISQGIISGIMQSFVLWEATTNFTHFFSCRPIDMSQP